MTIPDEVDIIVCGGGSAGCVPAGRKLELRNLVPCLTVGRFGKPGP